ncbi:High-affinity branched-chain amino acid transport system permease protein LivH [Massilia sp. Bi118]|uniref:branched-chain amino acid ABC transporter permease n=1 Tax=Massilia sp. Bi118 TaxID=2822346 RepID=UPI001D35F20D|nr:branched-chain amino acid ABC transporter permease [Massilia sp. Bi118]CAH0259579.1 High-affinity branched-chain amino acid transport system permease protein LivH [Massilia sp. Bi118]
MSASLPLAKQADAPLPAAKRDLAPLLLVPALALAVLPFVSLPTWVTLTVAGLAMGMMIFIMASGLTLVFGLMSVLNFGHGAFVSVGAFSATLVLLPMRGWLEADSLLANLGVLGLAVLVAMLVTALIGWAFERIVIMPVYGQHLKQILITMGGMIVSEQLINVIWGAEQIPLPLPATLRGAIFIGEAAIEKYRLLAVVVGLVVFAAMFLTLNRTKIGLLIRAGVENGEMVEAMGYRIRRLFVGVFAAGSALAGLGGVMWGLYKETLVASMGSEIMVMVFIVVIIGGLGSVGGCFIGALLMALLANYAGFLAPKLALVSNIVLMIAILLWRPAGLYSKSRG